MKKNFIFLMAMLSFLNLFGEIADKHYTTNDYFAPLPKVGQLFIKRLV